ncbi:MAG TPA: DUF5700 domain-containing putative Zn-dependent protease [Longimicrobium sp.]|jgi:hypothetical protein
MTRPAICPIPSATTRTRIRLPLRAAAAVLLLTVTSCVPPQTRPAAPDGVDVRVDAAEAEAALEVIASASGGRAVSEDAWNRLRQTAGYRRLVRREAAMGRAFTDSAFLAFLRGDSLAAQAPRLAETLARWKTVDAAAAGRLALAYLPHGTALRATIYPMVKPRPNSFVSDVGTDSAAIFLYLDPSVTAPRLRNRLAHELHHVGFAVACLGDDEQAGDGPAATARTLAGGFGEGIAMLAAAGSPDADPHAASTEAERERWRRDYARWPADLRRVDDFLSAVATGRLADADSIRRIAGSFYGDAQGAWYTVGYAMASRVEREFGRERLVAALCTPAALMRLYNQAAARAAARGETLPTWSPALLDLLDPNPHAQDHARSVRRGTPA